MQTHDHGAAGAVDFAKGFREPGDAKRIKPSGRLIEEQDGGTMHQGAGDGDTLAHAAGEGADEGGAAFVKADFTEKLFGAGGRLWDSLKLGEEDEIFLGGEFVINHGGVGDVAWAATGGGVGGSAGEGQLPCRGSNDASGDAEERGFAGAVASGEDDTFTGRDFEGDAAKGEEAAKTFIDIFEEQAGWRER